MRAFLLLPLLALAACDSPPQPGATAKAPPPPAQICAQVRKALEQVSAEGVIDYDDKGEATIPEEAWLRMGDGRNQFAQTLGFHAACATPDGAAERRVLIRNEYGRTLMEAMVPTGAATDLLLGDSSPEGAQP